MAEVRLALALADQLDALLHAVEHQAALQAVGGAAVLIVVDAGGARGARGLRGNVGHLAVLVHRHLRAVHCLELDLHPVPALVGDHAFVVGAGALVRELVDGVAVVVGQVVHGPVRGGRVVDDLRSGAEAAVALLGQVSVGVRLEVDQVSVGLDREVSHVQLPPGPLGRGVLLAHLDVGLADQVVGVVGEAPVLRPREDHCDEQQAVHDLGVTLDHRRDDDRDSHHQQPADDECRQLLEAGPLEGPAGEVGEGVHEDHGREHGGEDAECDPEATDLVGLVDRDALFDDLDRLTHHDEDRGDDAQQGRQRHDDADELGAGAGPDLGELEEVEDADVLGRRDADAGVGVEGGRRIEPPEGIDHQARKHDDQDGEEGHDCSGHTSGVHE